MTKNNNTQEFYVEGCISADVFSRNKDKNIKINEEFTIDKKYDCFVVDNYGAWMGNTDDKDIINHNIYKDYSNNGYEIVIGPPNNNSCTYGIFCKNYKEVAKPYFDRKTSELLKDILEYIDDSIDADYYEDYDEEYDEDYNKYNYSIDDYKKKNLVKPPLEIIKKPSKKVNLKDVNEVIDNIKSKFVGQDEAIEAIVSNIYANQIMIDKNPDLLQTQKASILIDGPTGTGKTAIMKEIAKELNIPIVITSATRYSQTGYVGDSLDSILEKLVDLADGDIELAQRGIICFDEIDKLGHYKGQTSIENMHESVQEEILSYMSGEIVKTDNLFKPLEFDTTNTTFIGMGAFTDLREYKIKYGSIDDNTPTMGFTAPIKKKTDENKEYTITDQDYIDFGLKRELVGRFTLQTYTHAYSKEDYMNILKNSCISPIKQFEEFAHTLGINNVIYDDKFLESLSKQAYDDNFGARGLQKIVNDLKNLLLLDMINSTEDSITLTNEMLEKRKEKTIRRY